MFFTPALLPKNVPGSHLYEIAQRLAPAYYRVTKKENYPEKARGIIGVGDYEYKTKLTSRTSAQNTTVLNASTSGSGANKSTCARARKLRSRMDDHIHDEDVAIGDDLDDVDIAHLRDNIDGIDIEDGEGEQESCKYGVGGLGVSSERVSGGKLKEEDIAW